MTLEMDSTLFLPNKRLENVASPTSPPQPNPRISFSITEILKPDFGERRMSPEPEQTTKLPPSPPAKDISAIQSYYNIYQQRYAQYMYQHGLLVPGSFKQQQQQVHGNPFVLQAPGIFPQVPVLQSSGLVAPHVQLHPSGHPSQQLSPPGSVYRTPALVPQPPLPKSALTSPQKQHHHHHHHQQQQRHHHHLAASPTPVLPQPPHHHKPQLPRAPRPPHSSPAATRNKQQTTPSSPPPQRTRSPPREEDLHSPVQSPSEDGGDKEGEEGKEGMMWPAWVYCTRYSDRPSAGPRSRKMKRRDKAVAEEKRPRTAFTNDQLEFLRREFEDNKYLTEERRQRLAKHLDLTESQIKIWFQNKRAKLKKSTGSKNSLTLSLMAQGLYNHKPSTDEEENTDAEKSNSCS